MKTQYLTTIEFRYNDAPKYDIGDGVQHLTKTITLGVFETITEANTAGNKVLESLESKFNLNPNYNRKQRLGGDKFTKNLISNLGYIQTPFTFYLKITELKYDDVEEVITNVLAANKRYKEFKTTEQ